MDTPSMEVVLKKRTLKLLDDGYAHKNYVEVEWMKQIQTDFVRAEKVDKALDLTNM